MFRAKDKLSNSGYVWAVQENSTRKPLWVFVIAFLMLSVSPEASADGDRCTENRLAGEEIGAVGSKLFGIEYASIPTLLRRVCGLAGEADEQTLRGLVKAAGCSWQSDLGQMFQEVLTGDIRSLVPDYEKLEVFRKSQPLLAEEHCRYVADIPWPIYDADGELISGEHYRKYSQAMNRLDAWRRENLEPYAED